MLFVGAKRRVSEEEQGDRLFDRRVWRRGKCSNAVYPM